MSNQITVNSFTFVKLKQIKLALSRELDDYDNMDPGERGSELSWNAVMIYLIKTREEVKSLKSRIKSYEIEVVKLKEGRGDEMKDLLEKSLVKQPIYIQAGAMAQSNISGLVPPGPPRLPPKNIVIPISDNIKKDLKIELDQLFDGNIPRPSLIKKAVDESRNSEEKEEIE